ncbi:protein involved in NO response [Sulfolobus acidocaldarius SUSAZ]|nr:protein involved in NO response [Sulfolobus acidocaldarius SUSAZ]
MRVGMLLLLEGFIILLFGGIPAVLTFMDIQGFPYPLPTTFFEFHWFVMIYGFFLTIIGNEILVALSMEWKGEQAPDYYVIGFAITVLISLLLSSTPYSFYLVLLALGMLIYHSRIYLSPSKLGLRPTTYNYLLFVTLIVTVFVTAFQIFLDSPWISLIFPTLTIFSVMSRDIGLVFGGRLIKDKEIVFAYVFLLIGLLVYPNWISSLLIFAGWFFSFHGSGLIRARGRVYPKVSLSIAWIWLLLSSVFSITNYDAFIHTIAVGFLFNTVFGVDVVLIDMLISATGVHVKVKPSYIPIVLLNLGLLTRVIFDMGVTFPLLLLSAPLQGIGILSFYLNTFRQVFRQLRKTPQIEKRVQ